MRVMLRASMSFLQISIMPGKWLIFWYRLRDTTRSMATDMSVQNITQSSSSPISLSPNLRETLCTESYLQLVRLMPSFFFFFLRFSLSPVSPSICSSETVQLRALETLTGLTASDTTESVGNAILWCSPNSNIILLY